MYAFLFKATSRHPPKCQRACPGGVEVLASVHSHPPGRLDNHRMRTFVLFPVLADCGADVRLRMCIFGRPLSERMCIFGRPISERMRIFARPFSERVCGFGRPFSERMRFFGRPFSVGCASSHVQFRKGCAFSHVHFRKGCASSDVHLRMCILRCISSDVHLRMSRPRKAEADDHLRVIFGSTTSSHLFVRTSRAGWAKIGCHLRPLSDTVGWWGGRPSCPAGFRRKRMPSFPLFSIMPRQRRGIKVGLSEKHVRVHLLPSGLSDGGILAVSAALENAFKFQNSALFLFGFCPRVRPFWVLHSRPSFCLSLSTIACTR